MFSDLLRRFAERTPLCVVARAALERLLSPAWLDELFRREARHQYEHRLPFSEVVGLMAQVVSGRRASVAEAHRSAAAVPGGVAVTCAAVYQKLNGAEPHLAAAVVRRSAAEARAVMDHLPPPTPAAAAATWPPGFAEVRVVDGNHLAATEHRLAVTRGTRSGPLPGQALAVLDPARKLIVDVVPCEDGHAQERSLVLPALLALVNPGELWVADRNFCTTAMLFGVAARGGFFLIRQHASTLAWEEVGPFETRGRVAAGAVAEQPVRLTDRLTGRQMDARRVRLALDEPTRDGEREVVVLSNVPAPASSSSPPPPPPCGTATAGALADAYGGRWQVEGAFGEVTASLACEVATLGYPRAAILAFCLALATYNALSLVRRALAAAHAGGGGGGEDAISFHHVARELAAHAPGMEVAVDPAEWRALAALTPAAFAATLVDVLRGADLARYRKSPRGPRKPRPPRTSGRRHKHVATARLLAKPSAGSG
jgi:hypothetical protein